MRKETSRAVFTGKSVRRHVFRPDSSACRNAGLADGQTEIADVHAAFLRGIVNYEYIEGSV